ncbi:zinc carboxypeptidase [Nasonia vitripennis]|uniref:Peptidase M14 domain-containing protein n=1 Tax=Nasonia vitripennis TaxID=7425 RepID=A0A7M7Q0Z2_NASVI|nr:zinc carboxypeptidase [Nasonia vitripennis]
MITAKALDYFIELMNDSGIKDDLRLEESFHTLDEIYDWLDNLPMKYCEKVETIIGGHTYEGRDIKGVKISHNSNKPGIFIEGGIHAWEWILPATVTFLINELLSSTEPTVHELSESYDWYIFPSINPDGYVYTHTSVNHSLQDQAVLAQTLTETGITNGCKSALAMIRATEDIFAQLIMVPYAYTKEHLDNYNETYSVAVKAAEAISKRYGSKYTPGSLAETMYPVSGVSVDWVKAVLKLPLAFAYELRDRGDFGMLLPPEQIIPTGQEVVDSLIVLFEEGRKLGYS